jgi:hypothetical protein
MTSRRRLWPSASCAFLAALLLSCGGGGGGGTGGGTTDPALERYDVGFLSVDKPRGWTATIAGRCGTLALVLTDPQEPLRQLFTFSTIGPVYTDARQPALDQWYVAHGGFDIPWLDAPVVVPFEPGNFLAHWPAIARMKAASAFLAGFPALEGLKLVSMLDRPALLAGARTAEARGLFTRGTRVGEGLFLATVPTAALFPYNGNPGAATGWGYFLCGATAPKGELSARLELFLASLDSFTVTQAYVDECLRESRQQWEAVARAGQTLREASDALWEGWVARTHAEDILAERYSDGFRGVERVYDPSTGAVYEVSAGWYADYDAHRGAYQMSGLEPLPDGDYALWMAAVRAGSQIH